MQEFFNAAAVCTTEIQELTTAIAQIGRGIERFNPAGFDSKQKEILIILLEILAEFNAEINHLEQQPRGQLKEQLLIDTRQKATDLKRELGILITGVQPFALNTLLEQSKTAPRRQYQYNSDGAITPTPLPDDNSMLRICSILKIWRRRWFGVPFLGRIIAYTARKLDYETNTIKKFRTKIQIIIQASATIKTESELLALNTKYQELAFTIIEQPEQLLAQAHIQRQNFNHHCEQLLTIISKLDAAINAKLTELKATGNLAEIAKYEALQQQLGALGQQINAMLITFSTIDPNHSNYDAAQETAKDRAFLFQQQEICSKFNQIAISIEHLQPENLDTATLSTIQAQSLNGTAQHTICELANQHAETVITDTSDSYRSKLADNLFEKLDALSIWSAKNRRFLRRVKIITLAMLLGLAFVLSLLALPAINALLIAGTISTPFLIVGIIMVAYMVPCCGFAAAYLTSFGGWFQDQEEPIVTIEPTHNAVEPEAPTNRTLETVTEATGAWAEFKKFKNAPLQYLKNYLWSIILPPLKRQKNIWITIGIVTTFTLLLVLIGIIPGGLLGFLIAAIPTNAVTWLAGMQITYLLKDVTYDGIMAKIAEKLRPATSAIPTQKELPAASGQQKTPPDAAGTEQESELNLLGTKNTGETIAQQV